MNKYIKLLVLTVTACFFALTGAQSAGMTGTWTTPKGWKIKIHKCGGSYCGKVVVGTSAKDAKNSNKALRSRTIVGIRLIWAMKKSGSGFSGKLYNPNDGKTYTGKMSLNSPTSLKLSGCALAGLICKSQIWKK